MRLPELFRQLPPPWAGRLDPERPWELLGEPLDDLLAELPSERLEIALSPDVHVAGDRIVIEAGVTVQATAVIEGPVFIGAGCVVRAGATVRGGCWLGPGSLVGANTEVKHSILLAAAKAPHLSYVGDSIVGAGANLGAGTVLSNFRHDGREVVIPHPSGAVATGRRKLGAILGDGVRTGCNSVLHPGCVVGRDTSLYPGVVLRSGVYEASSIVKLVQQQTIVERRTATDPDPEPLE